MLLKRHYTKPTDWQPQRNVRDEKGQLLNPHRAPGVLLNPPPLSHLEVKHTGVDAEQHFSTRLVKQGQEEGWIQIADGTLTLYAKPESLVYSIRRGPGRYSCFDDRKLPDDDTGALARAYLAEHHAGQPSPDPAHPAGYYMINYYDCVLNAEQQNRLKLRKGKR